MAPSLLAGFAESEFTPEPGLLLFGQMHERVATHARDPLSACAAAFAEEGETPLAIVAADVCVLDEAFVASARAAFERRSGVSGDRLLLHATHTHTGPSTLTLMAGQIDAACMARLEAAVVEAATSAVQRLAPATVHAGMGRLDGLVFNRRGAFADGTSAMYGHAGQPGFRGAEGPADESLPVLWARRLDGTIAGVVLGFGAHPCAVEGASYYSADVPGEVRRRLAGLLGGAGVVFLTGAAGDASLCRIDPWPDTQPWHGEEGLARAGLRVAGEAARAMSAPAPAGAHVVRLARGGVRVPPRPWPAPDAPNFPRPLAGPDWPDARPYYERAARDWPEMEARGPIDVPISVARIGDTVICANPCELFVEFGLAIREASPAPVTLLAELTDGYAGYAPTPLAMGRGGYETWPAPTSKLAEEAGERIVAETRRLLLSAFDGG
ncbi:MAG: hypothetical protein IT208_14580 [Chthonomonadales bacterium]|nr:hypothetical protein [Chthonomonadales bacterium]